MTSSRMATFSAIIALGLGVALPGTASAGTVPAFNGIAATPSEAGCWSHGYGAITNNCTAVRRWCMPLPIFNSGVFGVYVTAYGATYASNVSCFAVGLSKHLTQVTQGYGDLSWYGYGTDKDIYLGTVSVPDGGALYTCCDVQPGGRINSVNYWQ